MFSQSCGRAGRLRVRFLALLLPLGACEPSTRLPDVSSEEYRETVDAFYASLASLQAGSDVRAEENLERVTDLAPGEPAGWANRAVLAMRQERNDEAARWLERARTLAPEEGRIELLLGTLQANRGDFAGAIGHLRRAVELAPADLRALHALSQAVEREAGPAAQAELERLSDAMLRADEDNQAVLLDRVRLSARAGDRASAADALGRLTAAAQAWPAEERGQLEELRAGIAAGDAGRTAARTAFLRNALLEVPGYRTDLAALESPPGGTGELFTSFVRLPVPVASIAVPDSAITFSHQPAAAAGGILWTGALWLAAEWPPTVALAGAEVRVGTSVLPNPVGAGRGAAPGILTLDYDYDFLNDLLLAGPAGVRLYRHDARGGFTDVTPATRLPASVLAGRYSGAWAADVDSEGDLDVVLGAQDGPLVLRNNGDGSFATLRPFGRADGLRGFAWADFDADGDPDAALLDASGGLSLLANERGGRFTAATLPPGSAATAALAAADLNGDGLMDLVVLGTDGELRRMSWGESGWRSHRVASWRDPGLGTGQPARLLVADVDNNGGLDVVVSASGSAVWLRAPDGSYRALRAPLRASVIDVADLTADGRLDLLGLRDGEPVVMVNNGTKGYFWQEIRPRAALGRGDQRVNSFGVGGEAEIRAGLLFQKQPITGPVVHFGLGEQEVVSVARIVWPNGDVQAEFDLRAGETIATSQRLKGSCPWLFAFDGEEMRFVTDFIWRSPLGLAINGQETAGTAMTEDRVRIRGDQLVARNGMYDLRITAELWETHFFDHVSLMVVDHPAGTEIQVDERFAIPPPDLSTQVTTPPRPLAAARDDTGRDVAELIRSRDGRHLASFPAGEYQGITRHHSVELELPAEAPASGLRLVGFGWIRPTDSSINVAISQGSHPPPSGLSIEIPDGRGGWKVARAGLGFPAGKLKTVVLDLDGIFPPGAPRRLRLRTNLEIYWDALGWASARPDAPVRARRLAPATAELRYRGFSRLETPNRESPEVPLYVVEGTAPRWRDLVGYHTRFGDVRELLAGVDDRYVIMNAGDEMRLLFPAPPAPPPGWVRDFVLIGDGWEKDGDYNTGHSRTVLPLPSHSDPAYSSPLGPLRDDPVYRKNPGDWQKYHTRYVTPEPFHYALRPDPSGAVSTGRARSPEERSGSPRSRE